MTLQEQRQEIVAKSQEIFARMAELLERKEDDTQEYHDLVAQFDKLADQEDLVMEKMGIFIGNPCPASSTLMCGDCTGWYRKVKKFGAKKYEVCREGSGNYCDLKSPKN